MATYTAVNGNQTVTGTVDDDTYDMVNAGAGGSFVDLQSGLAFSSNTGLDTLVSIENVRGSSGDDGLFGTSGANIFFATTGTDTIDGRDGIDTYDASTATSGLQVDLTAGTVGGAYGGTLANIENAKGGTGDDTLVGSSVANTLVGNGGADTLTGGAGNDVIDGGAGQDTALYSGAIAAASISQTASGWSVAAGADGSDTLSGVEIVDGAEPGRILLVGNGGFATLQLAIDAADAGDTIIVASGAVADTGVVDVDKALTILGANRGVAGSASRGGESVLSAGLNITADGVVIDGFTILGGSPVPGSNGAIYVTGDDVTVTNSIIDGNDSTHYGFVTPSGGNVSGLTISGNLVTGWDQGGYFNPSTQFTVSDNTFRDNGNHFVGDDWADGTFIDGNDFGPSVGSLVGYGVLAQTEDVGAFFGDNTLPANGRFGIFLYGADGEGQTVTGTDANDRFFTENATQVRDDVLDGGAGNDRIESGLGDDVLTGGTGNDALDGGGGIDTATFDGDAADFVVARTTTGFTVTETASGDVDTLTGIERLSFSDGDILYVGNGGFATIQAAVDAAGSGDTIVIAAGTYTENVSIADKELTILGANDGNGGTGTRVAESIIKGRIEVTGSQDVSFDGLRFLADGTTGHTFQGTPSIYLNGSGDYSVTNTVFFSDAAGGGSGFTAITLPSAATGAVTIADNLFTGSSQNLFGTASWQRAIWSDGNSSDLDITGNTFQWVRTGTNLDGYNDATHTIADNIFETAGSGISVGIPVTSTYSGIHDNDFQTVGDDFNFQSLTVPANIDLTATNNRSSGGTAPIGGVVQVRTGSGADTIKGSLGADIIISGAGNDTIINSAGNDTANGGLGTDTATFTDTVTLSLSGGNWQAASADDTDTLIGIEIVQDAGGQTVLVSNGGFATIQAAVNAAAPGAQILIAPGTYPESVTIDKAVSLVAVGEVTVSPASGDAFTVNTTAGGVVTLEGISVTSTNYGVLVHSAAVLDELVIDNATFTNNRFFAVGTGDSAFDLEKVTITNSTFLNNGVGPASPNGSGSICLVGFTGDATIENVSILNTSTSSTPVAARADNAIQIGGRDPVTYDVTEPAGDIQLKNVQIAGWYHKPPILIQGYTDLSGITFENISIVSASDWGPLVFIDPVSTSGLGPQGVAGSPGYFDPTGGFDSVLDLSGITVANLKSSATVDVYVRGSAANDIVTGTNGRDLLNDFAEGGHDFGGDDQLFGRGGNDTLIGGIGNDILDGGTGNDTMTGGVGDDTYSVDSLSDSVVEAAGQGIDTVRSSITLTLGANLENLILTGTANINGTGNALNNVITGNSGVNVLNGLAGADTMSGEAGSDTYYVDNAGDVAIEASGAAGGTDLVFSSVSYTLASPGLENLTLTGAGNLSGTGNALANVLTGNSGDNVLDGQGGADTLTGGAGSDTYYIENAGDVVIEAAGQGNDTVVSRFSHTLAAGLSVETLRFTTVLRTTDMDLTGNEFNQTITGNAGANKLDGGAGVDSLYGLVGDDTYSVDNAGDLVFEVSGQGNDTVSTSVSYSLQAGQSVETLHFTTALGTADLDLTGNEFAQTITGNAGANKLDGGAGADSLTGFAGDDTYYVDNAGDRVFEASGQGNDAVAARASYVLQAGQSVETLRAVTVLGTTNMDLTGNELAQTVMGNAGNNILDGGEGADILRSYGGADAFQFSTALSAGNIDRITDFSVADDTVQLDRTIFSDLALGTLDAAAFKDIGNTGAAVDASDRILYNHNTGQLFYDSDGSGAGARIAFAILDTKPAITAADFFVVA